MTGRNRGDTMNALRNHQYGHFVFASRNRAPAYAQHEQQDKSKIIRQQQQSKHEQAKPEKQHAQQPQKQKKNQQTQRHVQQQQKQEHNQQHSSMPTATASARNRASSKARQATAAERPEQSGAARSTSDNEHLRGALRNSSGSSRARGKSIVHNAGTLTTATGNNVAAITATESLTTVTADTLVATMASAFTACPSWSLVGTRASNIRAIG